MGETHSRDLIPRPSIKSTTITSTVEDKTPQVLMLFNHPICACFVSRRLAPAVNLVLEKINPTACLHIAESIRHPS